MHQKIAHAYNCLQDEHSRIDAIARAPRSDLYRRSSGEYGSFRCNQCRTLFVGHFRRRAWIVSLNVVLAPGPFGCSIASNLADLLVNFLVVQNSGCNAV